MKRAVDSMDEQPAAAEIPLTVDARLRVSGETEDCRYYLRRAT
jgi:hypothetical protein